MVKRIAVIGFFLLFAYCSSAQKLMAYVSLSTSKVFVGEPVALKVSVYTSTWFTDGIDIGNIQVDGALTVFFRSVASNKTIDGTYYSGVDFYYNVFPNREGVITIPSIPIQVESPKEGDYKGLKRTIKTGTRQLQVAPIPVGYDPRQWLVANSFSVRQSWSKSLDAIKVGDVLKRTIYKSANGTLAEFIPETLWDSIPNVSSYPSRPISKTTKTKTGVSATRSETISYLFETEGEVTIPMISYTYWNIAGKRFYKKQLDSIVIHVAPNPDIGMLERSRVQLELDLAAEAETDAPFSFLGLTVQQLVLAIILILITSYLLIKGIMYLTVLVKRRYARFRASEYYIFLQLLKAVRKRNYASILTTSMQWLHHFDASYTTLSEFLEVNGASNIMDTIHTEWTQQQKVASEQYAHLRTILKRSRKVYFARKSALQLNNDMRSKWLNPIRREEL